MRQRSAAVIVHDGKVLLFRRIKNGVKYFSFPGGAVESGETPEAACVREVREEMTMDIVLGRKILEVENLGNLERFYLVTEFTGTPTLGGEEKDRMNEKNQYYPEWHDIRAASTRPNVYPLAMRDLLLTLVGA